MQEDQVDCMYIILKGQVSALQNKSDSQIAREILTIKKKKDIEKDNFNVICYKYLVRQRNHEF